MILSANPAFPQGTATRRHAFGSVLLGEFTDALTLRHLLGRNTTKFGMVGE